MSALPRLFILTCTYARPRREEFLRRCLGIFQQVANLHWMVVEDGSATDPAVTQLLAQSGIEHSYFHAGPSHDWGGSQKEFILDHLRQQNLEGIAYFADDDNGYDPRLFDEIRKTQRISVFPVGDLGPTGIEKPSVRKGRIVRWISDWKDRSYPIDTGGFAFHTSLLRDTTGSLWPFKGRGGETQLLQKLVRDMHDFEPLCDDCRQCYVIHNLPLDEEFHSYLRKAQWVRRKLVAETRIRESWVGHLFRRVLR